MQSTSQGDQAAVTQLSDKLAQAEGELVAKKQEIEKITSELTLRNGQVEDLDVKLSDKNNQIEELKSRITGRDSYFFEFFSDFRRYPSLLVEIYWLKVEFKIYIDWNTGVLGKPEQCKSEQSG